jgi:hypothetical protein
MGMAGRGNEGLVAPAVLPLNRGTYVDANREREGLKSRRNRGNNNGRHQGNFEDGDDETEELESCRNPNWPFD